MFFRNRVNLLLFAVYGDRLPSCDSAGLKMVLTYKFGEKLRCPVKENQLILLGVDVRSWTDRHDLCYKVEVHKSRLPGCPGDYIL
jgi:hypothetical protein